MRRQLLIGALAIVLLVAGLTVGSTWVAQAVANKLAAIDLSGGPIVEAPSAADAAPEHRPDAPAPQMTSPPQTVHRLAAGEALITDRQISDYFLAQSPSFTGDLANTMLAVHEGQFEVRCMADQGWWFDPRSPATVVSGSPEAFALNGKTGAGDAYRWQDAGCSGRAVHEVGATS